MSYNASLLYGGCQTSLAMKQTYAFQREWHTYSKKSLEIRVNSWLIRVCIFKQNAYNFHIKT